VLRHKLADGAPQSGHGPRFATVAENANNILPGLLRAHAANRRHPPIRAGNQIVQVDLLSGEGDLPDRLQPTLAHPRIARLRPSCLHSLDAGPCPL
jgi:hypothetical protein